MEKQKREPFSELNRILDALKKRDLGPALQWVYYFKNLNLYYTLWTEVILRACIHLPCLN